MGVFSDVAARAAARKEAIFTAASYETAKAHLLTVANIAAPTGREQAGFVRAVREMEEDGEPHAYIITSLSNMLANGMAQGNWPRP